MSASQVPYTGNGNVRLLDGRRVGPAAKSSEKPPTPSSRSASSDRVPLSSATARKIGRYLTMLRSSEKSMGFMGRKMQRSAFSSRVSVS